MKLAKSKKKIILIVALSIFATVVCVTTITLLLLSRIDYTLIENSTYEVNTEATVASLFDEIKAGILDNSDDKLDTTTTGTKTKEATLISQLGTRTTINIEYSVKDTVAPTITGDDELTFMASDEIDILSHYTAEDNSGQPAELSVVGDYSLTEAGEYSIKIIAKDASNNEGSKEILLIITEPPRPTIATGAKYYIEVNREQNVVIVYSRDQSGNYSNIAKVFVASTGAEDSPTILGTYTVSDRYESLFLVGNVWGQYALRIDGAYFFHSVPYFSKGDPWDDLEYLEYNKLGSGASAGCVRLAAIDAKWIYDNIEYGTVVKIYDSPTLPAGVTKPSAIKIDENSPNRGWDPTDPDPRNPW
ncbi:MAG: L,D-transpeptidase [Candidatus Saccharibacteria bacterium]|nr:L,D-transpeptidase [Candidatus Saccharibacteria bacterium]